MRYQRVYLVLSTVVCILHALTLALFPVQFFFYFLYYTDAGATFLVLLGYLLASRNRHKMAAMVWYTDM